MPTSSVYWLALPGEEPIGPFTREEIHARISSSPPGTDWQVCEDGTEDWSAASTLGSDGSNGSGAPPVEVPRPEVPDSSSGDSGYLVLMHLSLLGGFVIPLAGIVAPIILWQMKKEDPLIDRHGREIVNWLIFVFIAAVFFALLALLFIGIPLMILLVIAAIVCPIIGAVKATNGEFYSYPMFIRFL
jgi:hypothetical protein